MRLLRYCVPILCVIALAVLFLKLPETPNPFGIFGCKNCLSQDPYFTLLSAAYFAFLLAISWLFPTFPSHREVALGGLLWAVLLGLTLTYMLWPNWCIACLIGHVCNSLIWMIWLLVPPVQRELNKALRERLCLVFMVPLVAVALFSNLNLTFMAYSHKLDNTSIATGLQKGTTVPDFLAQTIEGRTISYGNHQAAGEMLINFISPDCLYCREQLPILNAAALKLSGGPRFVNVISGVSDDLKGLSSNMEWIEDTAGHLRDLFQVLGYPTLFVVNSEGTIVQIIAGVPENLQVQLLEAFTQVQ